jgi:cell division protein FtsZ
MSIRLQLPKVTDLKPRITVVGVGGAGGNAVNNMIAAGLQGVDFVVANTDAQALAASSAEHRIQLGTNLTEGMGAGSKPEIGEAAAEEAIDDIRAQVAGSHMLFIAAGMGGGTGTGAAAVIARAAREIGILTVAVVTKPFQFEGARRLRIAEAGIIELKDAVDTLIVIPNQNLFRISTERTTFAEAFVLADQVLYSGIACIVDLIVKEGLINLDLADVKTVLSGMGTAMMGTGEASGEDRARMAAEEAIHNPLLDDVSLRGARGLLVSIIGGHDLTLHEVDAAANRVREEVDPEANIIVGATFDETLGDRVRVSIVASGMSRDRQTAKQSPLVAPLFKQPTALSMTPEVSAAHTPPPLPHAAHVAPPYGGPGELERRLAGALEPGSGYGQQFDGHLGLSLRRDTQPSGRPAEPSRRPGDVTIDERAPQYLDHIAASRPNQGGVAPESGYDAPRERNDRQPQLGRGSQRMPEISDFPPIAQHEYRVRVEGAQASPAPQPATRTHAPDSQVHKKPGLFQRIVGAGRVRKANAADAGQASATEGELPGFLARGKR